MYTYIYIYIHIHIMLFYLFFQILGEVVELRVQGVGLGDSKRFKHYIYIYIYIYMYMCVYIYIHIYIDRERERCMYTVKWPQSEERNTHKYFQTRKFSKSLEVNRRIGFKWQQQQSDRLNLLVLIISIFKQYS